MAKAEIRNLNVNCQNEQRLKQVKGNLEEVAKLLRFNSLHELIRWAGALPPEKVAGALRSLRIDEINVAAARTGDSAEERVSDDGRCEVTA